MSEVNEITAMSKALSDINENLSTKYLTKSEFKAEADKLVETVKSVSKEMDEVRKTQQTHPLFGTQKEAETFIDVMKYALMNSEHQGAKLWLSDEKSSFHKDLNSYGTGTGLETIPTGTSSLFSMLLAQGSVARKNATVVNNVHGNLVLTRRNGTSTAAFTASGGNNVDDAAVTPSVMGTAKVTLSPAQISILSLASDKLLYSSAINIAEMIATDLIEQAGVLEDNTVLRGDGTSTYGGNTGLANSSCPSATTSASSGFLDLDGLLSLPGKVHESVYSSDNAKYFISGAIIQTIKQKKASTAGIYFLDPETGKFNLGGYPVEIWHRVDNQVNTGKLVAWFGDMRKAVTIGVGRDMQLLVSRDYKFNTNQLAWRLSYDFGAVVIQPTAMASLTLTS